MIHRYPFVLWMRYGGQQIIFVSNKMSCTDTLFILGFFLGLASANWDSIGRGTYRLAKIYCRRKEQAPPAHVQEIPPVWEDESEDEIIDKDE